MKSKRSDLKDETLEYDELCMHEYDKDILARKGELWGKIDKDGHETLPCQYRYFVLGIYYKHDEVYQNSSAVAKDIFNTGEITEDSILQGMEESELSGLQELGFQCISCCHPHITSVEGIRLISRDKGARNWEDVANGLDDECEVEEFGVGDIHFEPAVYDVSKGVAVVGTMPKRHNYFELLIRDGERFDPKQLTVCGQDKCNGADLDVFYQGQPLPFLGMGPGDEEQDLFDHGWLYVDGRCICEEG